MADQIVTPLRLVVIRLDLVSDTCVVASRQGSPQGVLIGTGPGALDALADTLKGIAAEWRAAKVVRVG